MSLPPQAPTPLQWTARGLVFLAVILGCVYWMSLQLSSLYQQPTHDPAPTDIPSALAGEHFTVPHTVGWYLQPLAQGTLLIRATQTALNRETIDLCDQRAHRQATNSALIPLYIGWDWAQLENVIAANRNADPPRPAHANLKNPLLDDGPDGVNVPALIVDTDPPGIGLADYSDATSQLRITPRSNEAIAFLSDRSPRPVHSQAGHTPILRFHRDSWLFWEAIDATTGGWRHALRIQRLPAGGCAVGRLRVTLYPTAGHDTSRARRNLLYYAPSKKKVESFALAPGAYTVPEQVLQGQEDADLFSAATAAGLLKTDANGQVVIAPADLPRRQRFAQTHPELLTNGHDPWMALAWNDAQARLHKDLFYSAAGRYVRQQVDTFNSRSLIAALRLYSPSRELIENDVWQADRNGIRLALRSDVPLMAGRLFEHLPLGWQAWQRVADWPPDADATTPLRFHTTLTRPANSGEKLELLVLGQDVQVQGATVTANQPRCLTRHCREDQAVGRRLSLQLQSGTQNLTVSLQPLPTMSFPALFRYDTLPVALSAEGLRWTATTPDPHSTPNPRRATVTLRDSNESVLRDDTGLHDAAWELGWAALLGIDPRHDIAVAGNLQRLGDSGVDSVDARLTLDSTQQTLARQALLANLPAVSAAFGQQGDLYRGSRFASLVVMNADNGDILAAVTLPEPPRNATWSDLFSFDAVQSSLSPLRWWAWRHDGSYRHTPGSTFKTVSALALEQQAQHDAHLRALLAGRSAQAIARDPLAQTYDFQVTASCYPADSNICIHNFAIGGHYETLANRPGASQRYGLEEALRDSLNTWFAWLAESTDATLLDDPQQPGLPHVRALTPNALHQARPLLGMAAKLGFGRAQALDGGLLPEGLLRPDDYLLTSPSHLDAFGSRHDARLAAVGFRMQVTPLQMAQVAAAIATGRLVTPRLLLALNGREADKPAFPALDIDTQRIRKGMNRVPVDGTAQSAFGGKRFAALRPHLYAKTGTADLGQGADNPNNAWLIGWVDPGGIPGEKRRLAFACQISQVRGTGGAVCGPVIAEWLAALIAKGSETSKTEGN